MRRVIDGDTFTLESGEPIRLIGIDTPEYQPWKFHAQFYGKEARDFLQTLLRDRTVCLEYDEDLIDTYNRKLAYVYFEDGRFLNELLVREGYAKARYFPPNKKYYSLFKEAQNRARQSKKGLWAKP